MYPSTSSIDHQNQTLNQISKTLFGDTATLKIVHPSDLRLLKKNARYFKKETFRQLVDNIKKDQRLSSVPLCHTPEHDTIEVLSGNHRVQAAIDAGIEQILVIIITQNLNHNEQLAIQLSHNALVGLDDAHILKELWQQIDDITQRAYAGLSSDTMKELENIKLVTFTTPQVYTKTVTFAFTALEHEKLETIIAELETAAGPIYLSDIAQFNRFFSALLTIKKDFNIKNGSLAMLKLLEIVENHLNPTDPTPATHEEETCPS